MSRDNKLKFSDCSVTALKEKVIILHPWKYILTFHLVCIFINTDHYVECEIDSAVDIPAAPLYTVHTVGRPMADWTTDQWHENELQTVMLRNMGKFHTLFKTKVYKGLGELQSDDDSES